MRRRAQVALARSFPNRGHVFNLEKFLASCLPGQLIPLLDQERLGPRLVRHLVCSLVGRGHLDPLLMFEKYFD